MSLRKESVTTADGTTASPDLNALPVPLEPPVKRQQSHLADTRGRSRKKTFNSNGLTCLDSVDSFSIEVDRNCFSCRLDKNYNVRDVAADKVILKGVQDFNPFSFDGLKNVIVRDQENLPIARVCFKQKSKLTSSMALAVYAPCDVLAGTGEETSGLFVLSSKLKIRNSDGDELFLVEYNSKIFSSNFVIKSVQETEGDNTVAKIVDKSRHRIRMQIVSKMSSTSKMMLIGLCIALIHKFTPPNSGPE
ncbi:unnamed protein product [Orchesella dallaii]|uniref:Uncharacterized protein n=1 Tax=Orchesella dallaii TaxID=48710 RepID=A0ABP1QY66_9HEXA